MSLKYLPFEAEIEALDRQIEHLQTFSKTNQVDLQLDIGKRIRERDEALNKLYSGLSTWQRIEVARHPQRPQTADYIERLCTDWVELHGDRAFDDSRSIVTGFATIAGHRVLLIGQHKGRDINESMRCNFGYAQPEGYRKALWKMRLAEKYRLPIVSLIDTKGAAPAIEAEERGQSQAIAYNLMVMSGLKVPILCIIIAEGGSGGALGIGVGDRMLIFQNAYFSVIAPEGCASILWKDPTRKAEAAEALRVDARSLVELGIMDQIVPEPLGGAHRQPLEAASILAETIDCELTKLKALPVERLLEERYRKIRSYGKFTEDLTKTFNEKPPGPKSRTASKKMAG